MIGGDIKKAGKTIPLALILGISIVMLMYLLVNFSYSKALSIDEMASCRSDQFPLAPSVAAAAIQKNYGARFSRMVILFIMIATLTVLNNIILASARIPYAMARDKIFLPIFSSLNKNDAPYIAILAQALIAIVYVITGAYDKLIQLIIFSLWIFYALTVGSVFIFRK